ncbi:fibrous sheath CABYR-binding protein-like [Pleurodeles waltl]|uniref:fibrous sheath CABYR-binding protein-like n=1 Tax=Pleurodeles waltl TaxID=8319 RepID=UPI003709408A
MSSSATAATTPSGGKETPEARDREEESTCDRRPSTEATETNSPVANGARSREPWPSEDLPSPETHGATGRAEKRTKDPESKDTTSRPPPKPGIPENEPEQESPPSTPANSRIVWPPKVTKTPGPEPTTAKPPNRRGWHRSSPPPGEEETKTPPNEDEPAPATNPTPCEQTPTQEPLSEENSTLETNK